MLEKCVDYIVRRQLEAHSITEEDVPIYRYGYTLLLEVLLNIICSIVIGCIIGDFLLMGFLLLMIIPLRSFSGGWHAAKIWQCTILSNLALIFIIIMAKFVLIHWSVTWMMIADVILALIIWSISPVDTKTKRLTTEEKKVLKKKVFVILIIQILILFLLYIGNFLEYMCVLVMTHFVVTVLVFLGGVVNKLMSSSSRCQGS